MAKNKKRYWSGLFCILVVLAISVKAYLFFYKEKPSLPTTEEAFVNVYNWYGMIPDDIIQEFESETGIRVRYDLYDNNEIVEAKLFSGNSGYDVVFPSASPYIARQREAGVYQPINKDLIPNLKYVDPQIYEQMRVVDPDLAYAIPYYWGTFGFAFVEGEIDKRLPNAPKNSYRMLFDPEVVKHFSGCGVTYLDEAVDVYPPVNTYLGLDPHSDLIEDLDKAQEQLLKLRPHISRFSSSRFVNELVAGESCIAQAWSGEAHLAQERADEVGKNITIRYVVPEEGGSLWIDAIIIPKDAPHPKNAHMLINFLLRPDISARIGNETIIATSVLAAKKFMKPSITQDTTIYPKPETMKKLRLDKTQSLEFERTRTRYWTQFRVG